jgi:hypothetical protein
MSEEFRTQNEMMNIGLKPCLLWAKRNSHILQKLKLHLFMMESDISWFVFSLYCFSSLILVFNLLFKKYPQLL